MPPEEPDIGSEFHWDPAVLAGNDGSRWPAGHELFASGSAALAALLLHLAPLKRLHLPSYFCMSVAEVLSAYVPLAWYRHLPGEGPRLDTLRAASGEGVLAQNLFGREVSEPWDAWRRGHPGVVVVEDHSHDPFGDWARTSTAPYAVASLRKTLPVPDGGLLWSPAGLELPRPTGDESPGAALKLAAMLLKGAWREGRAVPKETFRVLQRQGEAALLGSTGPASTVTRAVLPLLDVAGLRSADVAAAHALRAVLPVEIAQWRVLGAGPFRVQLVCRSAAVRDATLAHLAANRIYAPVHWRQDRAGLWSGDDVAAGLAARMLTVPVDHRCTRADVQRVAEVLTRL